MSRRVDPAWWLVGPALAILAVFFLGPVLASFALSLTDFDVYAIADLDRLRFVGAGNYARSSRARASGSPCGTRRTSCSSAVRCRSPSRSGAALLLDAARRPVEAVLPDRALPAVVTTLVAVAIVWRALYHPRAGHARWLCAKVGIAPIDWLGDPLWAMPRSSCSPSGRTSASTCSSSWPGLQSVPERLYEAARLDGAGPWPRFRFVTLPVLAPTFAFVVVTTTIGYLQLFAEPYVMTQGRAGERTLSIVLLMYEEGFRWWNLGAAAAIAFVLFAIISRGDGLPARPRRRARRGGGGVSARLPRDRSTRRVASRGWRSSHAALWMVRRRSCRPARRRRCRSAGSRARRRSSTTRALRAHRPRPAAP
jgi:multiple sugar transport system permease protein